MHGPDFLPDGRHFLYERFGTDRTHRRLPWLAGCKTRATEFQAAVGQVSQLRFYVSASGPGSSAGYLLFTREGSLMAQPFDLRRLELAGEAVPIAQGMGFARRPTPVFGLDDRRFGLSGQGSTANTTVTHHPAHLVRSGGKALGNRRRAGPVQLRGSFARRNPRRG